MTTITYRYRGKVLHEGKNGHKWSAGYSKEGDGCLPPWMTKKECRRDAESQGKRPIFKEAR